MRIIFMGTPEFAVPVLDALVEAGHYVAAAYSQPPRRGNRGKVTPSPIQARAEALGIAVRTPLSLREPQAQADFAAWAADVAVVAAYGLILPRPVLEAPRLGCLNVHGSLLPRWRGAAPIQRAILAGDAETGVTIMQMDEGLDTGAMLMTRRVPIGPAMTAGELHDRLAALGAEMIGPAVAGVADGSLTPVPQPSEGLSYAAKIARDEARIDWMKPAAEIDRQIRAFAPAPGAWFSHAGERIKVLGAVPTNGRGEAGTVLDSVPTIACGEGALMLTRLQRAGRGPLPAGDFLRGFALPAGTKLDGSEPG
jgi:methionyl-tRNA formyltransferase